VPKTQPGQPSSFWLTDRGVVAIGFVLLELLFFATDSVGVPAHNYVSGDVGGTPYLSTWFMVAFLVPAALIMPLLGSLRARIGAKAIATLGPGLFAVACLIASVASDPQLFIAMRALQGLGAGVIPAAAGGYLGGQLGETYTPMGKGLVALALVSGSSMGIPVAALVTWHLSWRVLYAGLGLLTLAVVAVIARLMPATPGDPKAEIDWLGYGLMAGGFGLLTIGLEFGNQREWLASPLLAVMLVSAALLLALFAWRVIQVPKLIDLRIFQDINYCISALILSSVLFFLFMIFAIVPRFLVVVVNNTIENYAWTFMPFVLTTVITGLMVTPGVSPRLIAAKISAKKKAEHGGHPRLCLHCALDGSDQRAAKQCQHDPSAHGCRQLLCTDQLPGNSDGILDHACRADDQRKLGAVFLHQSRQSSLWCSQRHHPHDQQPGQLGEISRARSRRQSSPGGVPSSSAGRLQRHQGRWLVPGIASPDRAGDRAASRSRVLHQHRHDGGPGPAGALRPAAIAPQPQHRRRTPTHALG